MQVILVSFETQEKAISLFEEVQFGGMADATSKSFQQPGSILQQYAIWIHLDFGLLNWCVKIFHFVLMNCVVCGFILLQLPFAELVCPRTSSAPPHTSMSLSSGDETLQANEDVESSP